MADEQQVTVWCAGCGREAAHWRINAALRICTVCGEEIHKAEVIMAKHLTDEERAGIQLRLAGGESVKDVAAEMKRSYYTIYAIKQAMPKGLKGKKLEAALKKAASLRGCMPRGVSLTAGPAPAGGPKSEIQRFIAATINQRLGEMETEILTRINYIRSAVQDYLK